MTKYSQDFRSEAGDVGVLEFTVVDGSGTPIAISTASEIVWKAARDFNTAPVITKRMSTGGITLPGGTGIFDVQIGTGDTTSFAGYYVHWAAVTDASGDNSTVELGRWQVGPTPSWSYSGDPAFSSRDAVRFYIGDTESSAQILMDAEIDQTLTIYPNAFLAAAQCARTIAGRYSRKISKRVGDLSISYSDLAKQFFTLADELAAQGNTMGVVPYSGGTSIADMQTVVSNTDRPKPDFWKKQFDEPPASAGPWQPSDGS
jgi:hypothetical protein